MISQGEFTISPRQRFDILWRTQRWRLGLVLCTIAAFAMPTLLGGQRPTDAMVMQFAEEVAALLHRDAGHVVLYRPGKCVQSGERNACRVQQLASDTTALGNLYTAVKLALGPCPLDRRPSAVVVLSVGIVPQTDGSTVFSLYVSRPSEVPSLINDDHRDATLFHYRISDTIVSRETLLTSIDQGISELVPDPTCGAPGLRNSKP
jgi:hypothetical protein